MIPTLRFYLLLVLGVAIAVLVAVFFSQAMGLGIMILYDVLLLILGITDSYRGKNYRIEVTRSPLARLSIGRDGIM
ncbi:MAG: hypothetical protein VKL41_12695 [Snowella sp.]|nr:hypothetical protein [Snowella sp.]